MPKAPANKPVSIPESKLIVRKLRREENEEALRAALVIPIDYFHGMTVAEIVTELKRVGIKVNEEYVMLATRRIVKV